MKICKFFSDCFGNINESILVSYPDDYKWDYSYKIMKKLQQITRNINICGMCMYDSKYDGDIDNRKIWTYEEIMNIPSDVHKSKADLL